MQPGEIAIHNTYSYFKIIIIVNNQRVIEAIQELGYLSMIEVVLLNDHDVSKI